MLYCNSSKTFLLIASIVIGMIPCGSFADDQPLSTEARALLESSRRAYANDKFDDAVKFAKKATKLEPDASVCQLWLGIAYSEKTQSGWFGSKLLNARRCRQAFERAVELDSTSLDARYGLIEFHVRAPGIAGGSMETAWAQVEFIMQHDSLRGYLATAYIHERKDEDTSAAVEALLNAVAIDTTSVLAQLRLAGLYVRMGEHDKAESILKAAAESGDREALLNYGWMKGEPGLFRSILANNPHDIDALFFLAESYLGQGDVGTGDSLTVALADLTGECPEVRLLSAIKLSTTMHEPSDDVLIEVIAYLGTQPCIQYDPCWANPHLLADVHSHRPMRARVHYMLAGFYQLIPNESKYYEKHLEKALELDPTLNHSGQYLDMDRVLGSD